MIIPTKNEDSQSRSTALAALDVPKPERTVFQQLAALAYTRSLPPRRERVAGREEWYKTNLMSLKGLQKR